MPKNRTPPTPPALGTPDTRPGSGQRDLWMEQLLLCRDAFVDCDAATKPGFAHTSALADVRTMLWQAADRVDRKVVRDALVRDHSATSVARAMMMNPREAGAMKDAAERAAKDAIVGAVGDDLRDRAFQLAQVVVETGQKVAATIAQGQADFDGPSFLRAENQRKSLAEILLDQEGRIEVESHHISWTWDALSRLTAAGNFEKAKRLLPYAMRKAERVLKASPGELAKEVIGTPTDDALQKMKTTAMQILTYAERQRERERPQWIAKASAALEMTAILRRQLVGQDVAFLPHVDPDRGFSVARFMNPWEIDPSFLVRRLLPVQIPGWSRAVAKDHTGRNPGGIVREAASVPMGMYGGAPQGTAGGSR